VLDELLGVVAVAAGPERDREEAVLVGDDERLERAVEVACQAGGEPGVVGGGIEFDHHVRLNTGAGRSVAPDAARAAEAADGARRHATIGPWDGRIGSRSWLPPSPGSTRAGSSTSALSSASSTRSATPGPAGSPRMMSLRRQAAGRSRSGPGCGPRSRPISSR